MRWYEPDRHTELLLSYAERMYRSRNVGQLSVCVATFPTFR